MRDLPTQASQVFMDLEAGRLTFGVRDVEADLTRQQWEYMRDEMRMGGLRVSLALMASTVTLIGVGFFIAASQATTAWAIAFALIGLAVIAGGVGLYGALGIHVFFAGLLDIRGWRRRLVRILMFFSWRSSE